jgi:hypothetical protein
LQCVSVLCDCISTLILISCLHTVLNSIGIPLFVVRYIQFAADL